MAKRSASTAIDDLEPEPLQAGEVAADVSGGDSEPEAAAPEQVAAAGQAAVAEPVEPEVTFRDTLIQSHPEFNGKDDDAILGELVNRYAQARQLEQQLQQQQAAAQYYYQQVQHAQQQQAQPQAPAAAVPEKAKWNAPEYDPRWLSLVERDEQGRLIPVPGAAPDLPQKIQNYANWKQEQEQKFWSDPAGFMRDQLSDSMREIAREVAVENVTAARNEQLGNQVFMDNRHWLQVSDANGQPAFDTTTGQPLFTEEGQRAIAYARQIMDRGLANPVDAFKIAKNQVELELRRIAETAPQPAAQAQAQKNNEFLRRAVKKPQQVAQRPSAPAPNGPPPSFRESLTKAFLDNGFNMHDTPVR